MKKIITNLTQQDSSMRLDVSLQDRITLPAQFTFEEFLAVFVPWMLAISRRKWGQLLFIEIFPVSQPQEESARGKRGQFPIILPGYTFFYNK